MNFKNIQSYRTTHGKWVFQNFDKYKLGSYKSVGQIMEFLHKRKPNNIEDFFNKWIKAKSRYNKFENIVLEIKKIKQCSLDEAVEIAFVGLFYNSYVGYRAEVKAIEYLQNKCDCEVRKTDKEFDNEYAIDLMVHKDDDFEFYQVKSEGSKYNNNTNFVKRNEDKNNKFTERFGYPVQYLYYNYAYNSITLDFDVWFEEKDRPERPSLQDLLDNLES